jgi:uncharacterized protein (TIGR02453 family)
MSERRFEGFPESGLQFLAGLSQNNNREWFNEHKAQYLEYIVEPSKEFIMSVGEQLQFITPHIQYDTRTNGQGSLMRIYRDIRFSPDKTPYKTWVGIRFWEGSGKAKDNPGYFLWFDHTGAGLHAGMHGFSKALLEAYRKAVVDSDLGPELEKAISDVKAAGEFEVGGEHYKRVPRGYDKDHPRADLLRYNALGVSSPRIQPELLTSPALVENTLSYFEKMAPVQRWLVKVKEGAPE